MGNVLRKSKRNYKLDEHQYNPRPSTYDDPFERRLDIYTKAIYEEIKITTIQTKNSYEKSHGKCYGYEEPKPNEKIKTQPQVVKPKVVKDDCKICFEEYIERIAFGCGHVVCEVCSKEMFECPFCREKILKKIKLFL